MEGQARRYHDPERGINVFQGDQANATFWAELVAAELDTGVDIVLDDGGHTMEQQVATFRALWPALRPGGVFLVEDTHSSYWPGHGGGLRREGTFVEEAKRLIDALHSLRWPDEAAAAEEGGGAGARSFASEALGVSVPRVFSAPIMCLPGRTRAAPQTAAAARACVVV